MRLEMRIEAVGPGLRFGGNMFALQIGKAIKVNVPEGSYEGRVIAAEVIDDGRAAMLTVECDDAAAPLFRYRTLQDMSKGFSAPGNPELDVWLTRLPDVCSSMAGYYDRPEGDDRG